MIFPLVREMAAAGARIRVPVAVACRVLGFSTQAYYKWLKEPVSPRERDDAETINKLVDLSADDPTLGYRFLTDELEEADTVCCENRVHRLCRIAGIQASHAKKKGKAGKPGPPVHDDHLATEDERGRIRHVFSATRQNQVWLTDITEHPTMEGKLYLCVVKDVFSNRIVGYSIDNRMRSSLAAAAIGNAITLRSPKNTFCHSDRGSQGGFNRSSQHLIDGGDKWADRSSSWWTLRPERGGSGRQTGRSERQCAHQGGRSRHGRCSVSSGG